MKRKLLTTTLIIFLLGAFPAVALAGSAILHWQTVSAPDLGGYRIYYGTAHRSYGPYIPVGASVTTYTLNGLVEGKTYYFALTAVDTSGNESGYSAEVSKTIQGATQVVLICDSVNPASGTGLAKEVQVFETIYTYTAGAASIRNAKFLINTKVRGSKGIFLKYKGVENKLYMRNNSGTKWLGGYVPGSQNTISNKYGSLDCSRTVVAENGDILTIRWFLTLTSAFAGTKNLYMSTQSVDSLKSGWVKKGEWTIDPGVPVSVSVTPSSGSGMANGQQVFETVYMDPNGMNDIKYVQFLMNKNLRKQNAVFLFYDLAENKLYLRNKSNSKWKGGYAPGSQNVISNVYGMLDCSGTVVVKDTNTIRVKWSIIPTSSFLGLKDLYMMCKGIDGLKSDWVKKGEWTIN